MKILWFTNIVLPGLARAMSRPPEVVGGWMSSLLDQLRGREDVELAVATSITGQQAVSKHAVEGVSYYCLPPAHANTRGVTAQFAAACHEALDDFAPDLIHVHGTEEAYGSFTAQLQSGPPVVVSIQGLIHVYASHVPGGITFAHAMECGLAGGLSWARSYVMQHRWNRRGRTERSILAGNHHFIGRTAWDNAHVLANNPTAKYHHGEELLRTPFYQHSWEARAARPHSIFCTAAHSPLKGFHLVLDALSSLRNEFPDITVRIASAPWDADRGYGYYGRYLKALIDRRRLTRHVVPLPALDAEQLAKELAAAAVFVIPSLIENSPNSLAEAMLVGTPCVAAMCGGIPSMIEDGKTALGFHSGDAPYLAHGVRRIFTDATLAQRLSTTARSAATARHDPERVVVNQVEIYRQVVSESRQKPPVAARAVL
jgi:glycosyltransferase involved in cell wall biosynthesis